MPTKLNKAGNQQNYVPKGNGEASGEYGDSSGDNKNFQSFEKSKPKDTKVDNEQLTKETVIKEKKDYKNVFEDSAKNSGGSKKKTKEIARELKVYFQPRFDQLNEDSQQILGNLLSESIVKSELSNDKESMFVHNKCSHDVNYLIFTRNVDGKFESKNFKIPISNVKILKDSIQENEMNNPQDVFTHEYFHSIDRAFAQSDDPFSFGDIKNYAKDLESSLSNTYKSSNGMTLDETLNSIPKQTLDSRYNDALKEFRQQEIDYWKDVLPQVKDKTIEEIMQSGDYTEEQQTNIKNKITNYYKKIQAEYSDIGDIFSMQGYGFVFGFGHETKYTKGDNKKGNEFFAECGSAMNCKPKSYEKIKKYFPEAFNVFNELIDNINNKKLKTIGQTISEKMSKDGWEKVS